jgi:hypothetical protein
MLHLLDRACGIRRVADDGAVDRSGRYAGSAGESDASGNQHR